MQASRGGARSSSAARCGGGWEQSGSLAAPCRAAAPLAWGEHGDVLGVEVAIGREAAEAVAVVAHGDVRPVLVDDEVDAGVRLPIENGGGG